MATTVIGAGAIGTAITRRLLATGHHVTVWNRTPDRTRHLITAGAHPADSPLGDGGLPAVTTRIETLIAAHRQAQGLTATIDPTAAHPPAPPRTHH